MIKEISHAVLVIPGLGDNNPWEIHNIEKLVSHWQEFGLTPIIHRIGWKENETAVQPRLAKLIEHIDQLSGKFDRISVVGTSAGGSAAFNAFLERKKTLYKAVNICGRLRPSENNSFRTLSNASKYSPAFKESVILFSNREHELTSQDRQRMMTVRAKYGDELVPEDTNILDGAENITIPTIEHIFSIGMALKPLAKPIIDFLTS